MIKFGAGLPSFWVFMGFLLLPEDAQNAIGECGELRIEM
jgi:hypothetical protein